MISGMRFKAATMDFANSVAILAYYPDAMGRMGEIAQPVQFTMVQHEPGRYIQDGTFSVPMDSAQSLLEALLDAGVKPKKSTDQSGEIARINDHLQDMRKLVFKK